MASQVDAVEREFLLCARYGELEEMLEELARAPTSWRAATAATRRCTWPAPTATRRSSRRCSTEARSPRRRTTAATRRRTTRPSSATRRASLIVAAGRFTTNEFGRSALTDAIASGDGAVATIALEHDSATEEKIIAGLAATGLDHVTHALNFAAPPVRVRELQISKAVDETLGDGGGASDRTGLGIWAASLALGRWLAEKGDAFDRGRVVELGGGCGVGGLALAAACPTARVVVTDCFAETLENAAHNVALFREDRPDEETLEPWFGSTARVASAKLDWDAEPAETCDFVVGADLVYHEAVVDKLVRTVVRLQATEFWYAAPTSGRAGGDAFLARLETLGFEHVARDAPPAYGANALADGDDDKCLLYPTPRRRPSRSTASCGPARPPTTRRAG
ncbi:hypothetical protein JL721_3509 [Aureococcus anophagefferens]|nr:hypothetical protein JL721_3509 [Aureococcus anophagefferens]